MQGDLVFEIGSEELPASFQAPAIAYLAQKFAEEAAAARLAVGAIETHATPRRLALLVRDVADRASDFEERGEGPAVSVAFDAEGRPTKAAEGFARKFGLTVDQLDRSGGRLVAVRRQAGQPTLSLLPELLARLAGTIPFRKSMRWGSLDATFARPVQWLLAVYGGEVVPVKFAGLSAGGVTFGHRFLAPEAIRIAGVDEYLPRLLAAKVVASRDERRARVIAEIDRVAAEAGGRRVVDDELVETITGLVEWPSGVLGAFGEDALDMPREVLVSEMRGHQKYASIEGADGRLRPQFVAVANTPVKDVAVSRRGYERVLRARLADARYFFEEDKKRTLASRVTELRRVTFQEKLGSIHDKVDRMMALSRKVALSVPYEDAPAVERAAILCKADLTTGMVGEFPDLQGVMGREYALANGETREVALALFEHYLPRGASDALPTGALGAIIGISDRLDTITGIFAIGKPPTGANDPFALRRACLGIIRIVLAKGWRLHLGGLVEHALGQHYEHFQRQAATNPPPPAKDEKGRPRRPDYVERAEAQRQVLEFFRGRLENHWKEEHAADTIDAVLDAGFDDITDAHRRLQAITALRGRPDFVPLAIAFGRASNIIEKQARDLVPGPVSSALFSEAPEHALDAATESARAQVESALRTGDYSAALRTLAELRPAVDAFFDKVLVMAEDPAVKQNRLRLVRNVQQLFAPIAAFARIQTK
jgi:glycyl-tRNA synthetase beta chain